MKFYPIADDDKVFPGEYLLHEPSQAIVLCGSFSRSKGKITALKDGRLLEDTIDQFHKINMPRSEQRTRRVSRCKGCGGGA
jgi:hypothetical protein